MEKSKGRNIKVLSIVIAIFIVVFLVVVVILASRNGTIESVKNSVAEKFDSFAPTDVYKSKKFDVSFNYYQKLKAPVTTLIEKAGCNNGTKEIVSFGTHNEINVNINSCITLKFDNITDSYELKSADGTAYKVSIYKDTNESTMQHMYIESKNIYVTVEQSTDYTLETLKPYAEAIIASINSKL